MTLTDPQRRAIRTFVQTFIGLFLAKLLGFLALLSDWAGCREAGGAADACAFPDVSVLGYGLITAGSAAVVALVTLALNWAEDNTAFPSLLKAPASSGTNPVPDPKGESGQVDLLYVLVAVLVVVVILVVLGVV